MTVGTRCDVTVVDDDKLVLMLVRRRLRDADLTLETHGSSEAALAWLRTGRTRLLLVDLRLGEARGTELIARLRDEGRLDGTRVHVFTAAAPDPAARDEIERLGASVLLKEEVLAAGAIARLLEAA